MLRLPARLGGVLLALTLGPWSPGAAAELPVFDAHLHYNQDAWDRYPPATVLRLLDEAGVVRAFVSSTPDGGTVRLYEAAPTRVVPVLRPYRTRGDLGGWHADPAVAPYLEARLGRGIYRGIGEFHLAGEQARGPVVRQVVDLAARHGLFLHCHCDVAALEILLGAAAAAEILWAHAGMTADPDTVGRLVAAHPRLAVELALRGDVAPGGRLDPAWRALFLRHPDRFLVGTDTWIPARWAELAAVQAATRGWLRQLPDPVARQIALENGERLARRRP